MYNIPIFIFYIICFMSTLIMNIDLFEILFRIFDKEIYYWGITSIKQR